jgi:hypothetical protein
MAALAKAYEVGYKPGNIGLYKIAASTSIYKGALVALDSDGFAIPIAHGTASLKFIGVAEETVVNDGADGDASVRVGKLGSFVYAGTAAQDDLGAEAYAVDDNTIQIGTGGLTNAYKVGTVLGVEVTANGDAGMRIRIQNYTI